MRKLPIYLSLLLLLTCAKEDNTALIEGYQLQISQLNSKITEYSNQVSQLQSTVNSLNSQVNTIPGLENTITSLNEQIAELEETTATLSSEVSTIPGLNDEIASLKETIASLKEQIEELEIISNTRTLTVSSTEGGSVTGAGDYQIGTEVTITATPDEGYEFTGWSDGETSSSRVITISSDTSISAGFEILTFQLTIVDTEGGTVSVESGSYDYGTELTIVASPNENYHFVEFTGYPKRQNEISVTINEDTTLTPNFLVKHDGVKTRNNYWYSESELEFLASENFIVWWDKDYDYLLRAISVLEEFENVMSIANSNGWGLPYSKLIPGLDASNHLMSLYIYTGGDSSDIIWESGKARCCGVGGNELEGMPYTGMDASSFNILDDGSFKLSMGIRMTLIHEAFHMMQFSMPLNNNGGNTFTYSGDSSWWTESTARWFERTYGILDWDGSWYTKYHSLCTQHLQPQVSLWRHRNALPNRGLNSNQQWSFGMNGYEKGELFRFLIQESYVPTSYVWDMGVSKSTLLPQEYLYQTINNFEDVYGDYAVKFTSGIMYNDIEVEAAKSSLEYWINNSCNIGINCNPETNEAFNNQYVAEINESGTNGYVTPVEKNQAWSWTVVKINTSQQQSFTLDFQPDELGNEGTQSNFKLYLTNRENNLVQQVNFNGEINVDPNLDYFLVMVNTPQRFEGWETFDYQLKVTPIN